MAPLIGLPLIIYVLSGAVITCAGFAAMTSVLSSFKEKMLKYNNANMNEV